MQIHSCRQCNTAQGLTPTSAPTSLAQLNSTRAPLPAASLLRQMSAASSSSLVDSAPSSAAAPPDPATADSAGADPCRDDASEPADADADADAPAGLAGAKRKLDKHARRASAKAAKKTRRAEWLKEQREQRNQEDEAFAQSGAAAAAEDESTAVECNPNGTQARQGQVTRESVRETEYFFAEGQRIPYAYWYEFSTYAKRRWVGRTLVDIMQGEFGK
jgi:hypothetical protein